MLNKPKGLVFKNGEQEGKTGPVWGLVPLRGSRMQEKDIGG
jgi:hypothetical protein